MGHKRNPPAVVLARVQLNGKAYPVPKPFPDDLKLRMELISWQFFAKPLSKTLQNAINFRLADLLQEEFKQHSPNQIALDEIEMLSDGLLSSVTTETQAIKEVARIRQLDFANLASQWRARKRKLRQK